LRQSGLAHRLIITSRYDFKLGEDDGRLLRQGLDSLKGADLAKKCERLAALHPQATTDAGLRARALSAADGNPRLLEWLDQVLEAGGVDTDALLAAMEAKGKEFREKVLTKALLAQLDEAARELLARLLVYELPVPKEAVAAVCEDSADFDEPLRRTVALGLLERIDMDGEPHYRAPRLLAEVLLPVRMTKKMIEKGRKVLCQVWSETGKFDINRGTEIHYMSMEIHGLKFLANSLGILEIMEQLKKAIDLTNEGNLELLLIRAMTHANQGQIEEAFQLYREALELLEANYNFLPDMSFVHSVQGWRGKILQCYPESLNLTKTSENIQDKATILYIMADIYADQGRWDEAIQLYQKSLERWEAADDIQGIAATKRAIAGISAKQGRTDESLRLYQESLKLWEANGNFPDKAATLDNMGLLMLQADQLDEAKSLFREAVSTWAQCRSWIDLVTALFNLGVAENECGTPRLAQTAWLMLRVVVPLPTYFNVIGKLFIQMSPNNALHTLLSALVTHQLNTDETPWPERPGMEEMRDNMCKVVAHYQGIETQAQFDAWWQQQQLNDPTHVRAELGRHLLALAGGDWLFDRALVEGNS
jgi:tetratricopeptide (TPR) repeat protein